ncbi:MAG: RHS repeat-associated core domain-containing protein [Muribaculaceae bacterium]|nr:RHS repeat-associated core domain-containing protein [Muribaculaceae bacterium]
MKVDFRHIITLIIASFISFTANADMLRPSSRNFSDVFATTTDRYQYSGKEFDRMNGLDLYDFHARQYDPVLGRFTTPDPHSEKYYHISPYAYCASNPLRYIEPTGMEIFINDENSQKEFKLSMLDVFNNEVVNSLVFAHDRTQDWINK